MRKKILTKECPSCKKCSINDNNQFICSWGNSKDIKVLDFAKGKSKTCKLK